MQHALATVSRSDQARALVLSAVAFEGIVLPGAASPLGQ